ncbi:aldehyde dehydrogenase family protein [Actinomadura sp. WMMB 499]|uniref:aldehyde dehydrogenase family protein n=1 Tax=Actinomadura sp. WMMB 499 TaxID=1219491 RepID=UPI0012493568|nr:aldehyde dehydrogenase family protein [Actinomadura sp. WMMB 499]QFG25024.1 aldehyde dehydrogenase family protein [Actinomadura sp. WMMB 499]
MTRPPHTGLNLIAGEWVPAAGGAAFERRNPADRDDLVGTFPDSSAADTAAAIEAVAEGAAEWADTPPQRRAAVLEAAADRLAERADELTAELVREEGKTRAEAAIETSRTPQNLRYYAGEALRITGQSFPADDGGLVYTRPEPVGVVGAITPWNFPLNIPSRKLGPALAAGNGVVFKPSPVTPLLAQRLVEALLAGGLPPGALALVQGGAVPGAALAADPRVDAVTFTGSTAVGRAIHAAVGPSRRCQLEMGGKNPVIVLDDADLDRAARIIVKGAYGLAGQACTGTSRVIAHEAVHDALLERVVGLAEAVTVGDGLRDGVAMGPLAADFQLAKVLEYVRIGQDEGAKLVTGGTRTGDEAGFFVAPAVFTGVTPDMRIAREEIFGPVLAFQRAASLDEALALADATDYGLAAGIVTRDLDRALEFARRSRTGLVKVNQPTSGMAMTVPFGGRKESSTQTFKEQAGPSMMLFYTQEKSIYVSP